MAKLTPRLERFFVEALGGQELDSLQSAEERRADFKCLRGLLAIELKSLEEDASERMDNLTNELREHEDWPQFFGSVPMESFLKHIPEPESVRRRIVERIGRAIKSHIRKANKQLAAHEVAFPRKNTVKVVVLVNEDHEIYEPELVTYIVQRLLRQKEGGVLVYPHIDAVIYLSERHATTIDQQIAFPIIFIEGNSFETESWKRKVMDTFLWRWSDWCNVPAYQAKLKEETFATIEHIPENMRRQELWELEYKRHPYMKNFTKEQIHECLDEVMCITVLMSKKNSPFKPDRGAISWSMETMSHLMLEMGWRALPMTEFPLLPERLGAAARRRCLPEAVAAWFETGLGENPT